MTQGYERALAEAIEKRMVIGNPEVIGPLLNLQLGEGKYRPWLGTHRNVYQFWVVNEWSTITQEHYEQLLQNKNISVREVVILSPPKEGNNPCFEKGKHTNVPVNSSMSYSEEPTNFQKMKAVRKRADWLKYCLELGFEKDQLDALAETWDKYHDEFGNLIKGKAVESTRPAAQGDERPNHSSPPSFEPVVSQDQRNNLQSEITRLKEKQDSFAIGFAEFLKPWNWDGIRYWMWVSGIGNVQKSTADLLELYKETMNTKRETN